MAKGALFIRTIPNVMQHYACDADTAQRYIDLRKEGYPVHQAALLAGLADPGDPDADDQLEAAIAELHRLRSLINTPELDSFLRAAHIEAVHQVERWGNAHDRAKRPSDWFWLVGYLAGKALHAAVAGDTDKARHHCISTAAALYNWHSAISGRDTRMCPGRSDLAAVVDGAFPGEAADDAGVKEVR